MIINETKNTYEDIKYMFQKAKKSSLIIGCRCFFVIAGLVMFAEAMNLYQKNIEYFNYISGGATMGADGYLLIGFIALIILLGIFFIVFNFFFLRFCVYRNYKKHYSKWSARHMEFGEDAVTISFEENGIKSDSAMGYELFKSYERANDALYIAIKIEGQKRVKYLCLHDDSYLSGDVNELMELLNKKI